MTTGVDIFTLVVYIPLLNPLLYCLWKHGKPGLLGWICLQSYCCVRIVAAILDIHNIAVHSTSSTSLILSNLGLSPLLLGTLGILHEARRARNPNMNNKWEWLRVLQLHMVIIGAIVLLIFGVFREIDNEPHTPNVLMKVGVIGILGCWFTLSIWTLLSWFLPLENTSDNAAYADGTTLLLGVLCGLPFLGVREIYALLSVFITNPNFKNETAPKVVLSVVPEMLVTVSLVFAGIKTRNIGKLRNMSKA